MEIRDPEFSRFFSEALKLLATRRLFCGEFIFRGFVRVFLFSFLSFCFLSLSFFQTDFSFASESQSSSRSLSPGGPCNKVLIKVGARKGKQPSASDLDNSVEYPWLGEKKLQGYWNKKENQKAYMKWLGEELGYTKPEDWYGLTGDVIRANSGGGLVQKLGGSPADMVKALVDQAPEGGWRPWLFGGARIWADEANQKDYMKWLGEKLGLSKPEDWYKLTGELIEENSGGLLKKFRGSPAEMVMTILKNQAPEDGWVKAKFNDPNKMEGHMRDILTKWFGGLDSSVSNNDRKTHGLTFGDSNRGMEADVLFEELKFAIEYHGEQHYEAGDWFGGQEVFEKIQKRDQEKRKAFKKAGYIYIEIPHFKWKGGRPQILKELILSQLEGYQESSDSEVKQRAFKIREALENVNNTQNLLRFGESDSSGSTIDSAASPNTASVGR